MSVYSTLISGESSLVSWYQLGDPSGTTAADSKGSNPGTYTGTVTLAQAPIPGDVGGGSFKTDGSSGYVSIGSFTGIPLTTAFTLEAWFQIPNGSSISNITMIGYGVGTSNNMNLYGFSNSTTLGSFWFGNDKTWTVKAINDGNWHHGVITWDGTTRVGYLDGITLQAPAAASGLNATATAFQLGKNPTAAIYLPANSLLAQCAIYNADLNPNTVAKHYGVGMGDLGTPVPAVSSPGYPGVRSPYCTRTFFFVSCSVPLPVDAVSGEPPVYTGGTNPPTVVGSPWGNALRFTNNSQALSYTKTFLPVQEAPWTLFSLIRVNNVTDIGGNRAGIITTKGTATNCMTLEISATASAGYPYVGAALVSSTIPARLGNWALVATTWDGSSSKNTYVWDYDAGVLQVANVSDSSVITPVGPFTPGIATATSGGFLDADVVMAGAEARVWSQADFMRFVADPFYPMRPPSRVLVPLSSPATAFFYDPVGIGGGLVGKQASLVG